MDDDLIARAVAAAAHAAFDSDVERGHTMHLVWDDTPEHVRAGYLRDARVHALAAVECATAR